MGGGVKEKVMGAVYSLKTLKWHTFLNIWLQTCLQTRLQTRPPELHSFTCIIVIKCVFRRGIRSICRIRQNYLILILGGASADASADKSAAKYSEMCAILGFLGYIRPPWPSLWPPPPKKKNNNINLPPPPSISPQNIQSGSSTQFVSTSEIEKVTTTVKIAYRWQH